MNLISPNPPYNSADPQATSKATIWIVEDDPSCRFIYEEILGYRYQLYFIASLHELEEALLSESNPHLILADLRLPDGSFMKFLGHQEKRSLISSPFIIVTSIDDLDILKFCFEEGAFDYLTKPFGKAELMFKVEKSLEKTKSVQSTEVKKNVLKINPMEHTISNQQGQEVQLTSKEFKIIAALWESGTEPVGRDLLMKTLWKNVSVSAKTLDVHIFNLRNKLTILGHNIEFCPPQSFRLK